ncbi:MAG: AMP-binding protein [Betaproteobacteria bacterium]|nr:AMP-binding protein [Betaproteobacteria bacterium]
MSHILSLLNLRSARHYYELGAWQDATLYARLRGHAHERGDAWAARDPYRRVTWSRLLDWVDAVAHDLDQAGLRSGDRVSVWLPSRIETAVTLLACSRNGYVCSPSLHQNYTVSEILDLLRRVDTRALVAQIGYGADGARHDVFASALQLPTMRRLYALSKNGTSGVDLPEGTSPFPEERVSGQMHSPESDPDKITYIAFTSGTTGAPKGVMHSDNTLLANGRALVHDWGHTADTVLLSLSPTSHHIATVGLEQSLVCGCEYVLHDPAAGRHPIDWIEETGATYVLGVPTHGMDILQAMQARGLTRLGDVSVFYLAGAPIPRETANRFLQMGIKPQNVYGMTENGSHQYTQPTDDAETIVSTCGRACYGFEVKIWKENDPDTEAAPGEVGEIATRGAVLMLGYFANQAATEASFNAHGWFMSGDLGRLDDRGNLQIVGRKKDLIIRGGHNIHPARIEDLAHRMDAVAKAAAFPVADERLGEKVCLAIIANGEPPAADEVLAHLDAAGLSKYDMPEYFIVLPEFPLTASGKILKRELAQWVRTGQIRPDPVRWQGK